MAVSAVLMTVLIEPTSASGTAWLHEHAGGARARVPWAWPVAVRSVGRCWLPAGGGAQATATAEPSRVVAACAQLRGLAPGRSPVSCTADIGDNWKNDSGNDEGKK